MKKPLTFTILLAVFVASLFFAATAFAVKPNEEVNPNGFPSGEHYNLNLNAKKSDYHCTTDVNDDLGDQVYGKVVFIPQYNGDLENVSILMESGKKGPKGAPNCTTLEVVDKCAGFDGDPATLRLPQSEYGYNVYLRAKGKPTELGEEMMILGRLKYVEDQDDGTSLIFLGTFTQRGLEEPLARPKGKIKGAVDITPLFQLHGSICYENALPDDLPNPGDYTAQCCTLTDSNGDGLYDETSCVPAPADLSCSGQTLWYCTNPLDYPWIFNIGDHVGYFWDIDNNGVRSAQVRFYPKAAP
ncbi:MAG: hypothetical protein GWN77_02475 [Gammaproteobacteria bacterium]|nr:hypothetical protein [Gammaproteobacteria bacterium]